MGANWATTCPLSPLVLPHPLSFNTNFFCYGSLCCCVGDCVVRQCDLHPLYSWQDILLTFAEMELDSTAMFTPGTNVMFIRSTGEPVLAQVVGYSGGGFPTICLHLPTLLPKGPNHHPRVLPKAFQWKVVSVCRSLRSSGAGPRNFTLSRSRSRSQPFECILC